MPTKKKQEYKQRHDSVTGALIEEPEKPPHSASGFERYLKSDVYKDHPLGYLPQIHAFVASLGGGKSTAIYGVLQELEAIMNPKTKGRTLYYTGSRGDKILEAYNPEEVEIYSPESKESFLSEIRKLLSDAAERAERRRREGNGDGKKIFDKATRGGDGKTMKDVKVGEMKVEMKKDDDEGSEDEEDEEDDDTPPHNIIVLDDAVNDADLMPASMRTESPIQRLFMSTRHIPCTILISAQKMSMLPTFIRGNAAHFYLFATHSEGEKRDVLKVINFSKREAEAAMNNITERGEFLWVNQANRTICRGFTQGLVH